MRFIAILAPTRRSQYAARAVAVVSRERWVQVEADRYHVYLGNACPWCHRVLLALVVLGLQDFISVGQLDDNPEKASRGGWVFPTKDPITGCTDLKHSTPVDSLCQTGRCRGVYDMCSGENGFQGRCTAPLLIDKKAKRIVSNESSLIVRNLNGLNVEGSSGVDLCPEQLLDQINALNTTIYEKVNNGVYKCGFATSQQAYNEASDDLFSELHRLDEQLSDNRFLLGDKFTECDLRLLPTLMRFDPIYSIIFHCSKERFTRFQNLHRWLRDVYQIEIPSGQLQVADTLDIEDARRSYCELFPLNPSGIIYAGPDVTSMGLHTATGASMQLADVFYLRD